MRKFFLSGFILIVFLLTAQSSLIAVEARASDRKIDTQEKKTISLIKRYFKEGKRRFIKDDFPTAIVKFNRVIKLEKDFYIIYTPYAKEYIRLAREEMKKKEGMDVSLDVEEAAEAETEKTAFTFEYTIGVGDVLHIFVWQEEALKQEVIVRPDGKMSFPLAGDVPAAGLTFAELKEELTQRLKNYVKYPIVSISLKEIGGRKVIVMGEVGAPGVYSVTGKSTLLEAIAKAGGFKEDAVVSSVILIRGGLERPEGRRLNLTRAIDKGAYAQNVTLQREDIIYVPKKFISNVSWAVNKIVGPVAQGVYISENVKLW